jgi:large subunit ribosomal protein L10
MNRDQKAAVIDEIAADITSSQAIFAVDYRGITVAQAQELRERLRAADATFRVVKNSLTERAADQAGADQLKALLEGPTALTFARGDAAAAAKAVADFARTTDLLAFKGGVMDGAPLSPAEVGAISRLPSRDVLYGQLVGVVASPIAGLARTLNALIGGLAVGLGGVLGKKESGELPAGEPPAAAAQEPPAAVEADGERKVAGDALAPAGEVPEAPSGEPVPAEESDKIAGDALAESDAPREVEAVERAAQEPEPAADAPHAQAALEGLPPAIEADGEDKLAGDVLGDQVVAAGQAPADAQASDADGEPAAAADEETSPGDAAGDDTKE